MTLLAGARRLVVKIGSSILVDETKGEVRRDWLEALTGDFPVMGPPPLPENAPSGAGTEGWSR